jgi:hypothetical protein
VHDVRGKIMLARRNEHLRAGDRVAAIGQRFGPGCHLPEIGAALRLGQAHRAGPFSAHQGRQIERLLCLGPVFQEGVDTAQAKPRIHVE